MSPEAMQPGGWPGPFSGPQLALDLLNIVSAVGDAAFAVDEKRRIVSWNRSAEQLFGTRADRVLGRPCHEVIQGRDVFGNVFCRHDCNVALMVRERQPVRRFELEVPQGSGESLRAAFSVLCLPGERASAHTLVHVVCGVAAQPARGEPEWAPELPGPDPPAPEGLEASNCLTSRETEVLAMLSQGASTPEIAEALDITVNTVRTHVEHILQKLGVHSKLEAVSVAHRDRLL